MIPQIFFYDIGLALYFKFYYQVTLPCQLLGSAQSRNVFNNGISRANLRVGGPGSCSLGKQAAAVNSNFFGVLIFQPTAHNYVSERQRTRLFCREGTKRAVANVCCAFRVRDYARYLRS